MKRGAKWRAASAQVVVERTDLCAELDGGKVELSSGRRFESLPLFELSYCRS